MKQHHRWFSLLVLLALVGTIVSAQEKQDPPSTRAQVEELLDKLSNAKSPLEREAALKELRELGEKAIPHLQAIVKRGTQAQTALALLNFNKSPTSENKTLRIWAELTVNGPGSTIGRPTPPNFRLSLQVENLTKENITLAMPTIIPTAGNFRIDRWYGAEGTGQAWNGELKAGEKKAISVIGEAGQDLKAGQEIGAKVTLDSLSFELLTTVKQGLVARCPCGCDRSETMASELQTMERSAALAAIEKALESIAERENLGYVTEQMIVHRLRLLQLAKDIQSDRQ